jgi:hypothetical protein
MRARWRALGCCAYLVCSFALAAGAEPGPVSEVQWAKGIAEDYWRALRTGKREQAAALLSPELVRSLIEYERRTRGNPKPEWPYFSLPGFVGPDVSVLFDTQDLAPDRAEVVFRGKLAGKEYGETIAADFTMRVAREGTGGRWSIRFLLVADHKEAADKR